MLEGRVPPGPKSREAVKGVPPMDGLVAGFHPGRQPRGSGCFKDASQLLGLSCSVVRLACGQAGDSRKKRSLCILQSVSGLAQIRVNPGARAGSPAPSSRRAALPGSNHPEWPEQRSRLGRAKLRWGGISLLCTRVYPRCVRRPPSAFTLISWAAWGRSARTGGAPRGPAELRERILQHPSGSCGPRTSAHTSS